MTIKIELRPDEERVLREHARRSGRDLADYVHGVLQTHIQQAEGTDEATPALDGLIDHEAVESCAREIEGQDIPSLEEVRAATAMIHDSMTRVVIEEERA